MTSEDRPVPDEPPELDRREPSTESSDAVDALAHADADESLDASSPDLSGSCPLEPELPLLLYDGDLEPAERRRLEGHVAKCARCEGVLAELRETAAALDRAPVVAPRAEKWTKLKGTILARTASREGTVEKKPESVKRRPKSASSSTPSEAVAAAVCATTEEDLLILGDLPAARRAEVLAHVGACAGCRESRKAFASVAGSLDAVEVLWPPQEAWDSLKARVLEACASSEALERRETGSKTGSRERPAKPVLSVLTPAEPITRASLGRRLGGWALRSAAVILVFGLGVYSSDVVRGLGPEGIHRVKVEADASPTLALALHNYELVIREGADRPEVKHEVDDSLIQLVALRRYVTAARLTGDVRRVALVNVMAQFPESRAAAFALADYTKTLEVVTSSPKYAYLPPTSGGFLEPNPNVIQAIDPSSLREKIVKIQDVIPESQRGEVQGVLAAAALQKALRTIDSNPELAKTELENVIKLSDPASPIALAAKRRLEQLTAAAGN
jgi:hypothetical protein